MVQQAKLVKQMEYSGKGLFWTGLLVYPKFLDQPNMQNLAPRIKVDPKPIPNARPDSQINNQNTIATSVGALTLDVSVSVDVTLTLDQFANNGSFNFIGELTASITVYLPNIFRQFYANNLTSGAFTLSMQPIGNISQPLIIPAASPTTLLGPILCNTTFGLSFVNF
jgi:hypothetical protein